MLFAVKEAEAWPVAFAVSMPIGLPCNLTVCTEPGVRPNIVMLTTPRPIETVPVGIGIRFRCSVVLRSRYPLFWWPAAPEPSWLDVTPLALSPVLKLWPVCCPAGLAGAAWAMAAQDVETVMPATASTPAATAAA